MIYVYYLNAVFIWYESSFELNILKLVYVENENKIQIFKFI